MAIPEIIYIGPNDKPLLVDPGSVGCGFILFSKEELQFFEDKSRAHACLETNKTELWKAVRRNNPNIEVLYLISNPRIPDPIKAVAYAFNALDQSGKYPGYSMTLDSMAISPDGGKTLVDFYVGFNWKSHQQELVVSGAQRILPGKPDNTGGTGAAAAATKSPAEQYGAQQKAAKWWQFWR